MELTADASVMCKDDWLEYATDPRSWGGGIKICDGLDREQVFETDKSDIYLNFNSDSANEYRGFWIQYSGLFILPSKSYADVEMIACPRLLPVYAAIYGNNNHTIQGQGITTFAMECCFNIIPPTSYLDSQL